MSNGGVGLGAACVRPLFVPHLHGDWIMTMPRVLTVLALSALGASSVGFLGSYALGEALSNLPSKAQPRVSSSPSPVIVSSASISQRAASPAVRVPLAKIKNRVLMVSRALLDDVHIDYNLGVP